MNQSEFIESVAKYVKKYANSYGIKVHSPIIAQSILESGWGESLLASKYHNYFGLKCGTKWKGKSVNLQTKEEYEEGTLTTISDNFRVYDSMEEGIKGYFEFIQLPRYSNLKGISDPRMYLETIKNDGYATASNYVQANMNLLEQYNLTKYDNEGDIMGLNRMDVVNYARSYIGLNESDGSFRQIIDTYNNHRPLAMGYIVKYTDEWCATFVSTCAIKAGCTSIIPTECSCERMINLFKGLNSWVENDAYIPKAGDIIFYDWDDSGYGDNTGWSDHVGIVESVNGHNMVIIEGNMSWGLVGRRNLTVNSQYIRGYGVPKYSNNSVPSKPSQPQKKPLETIAKEVINGVWGNGQDRKDKLESAGYDYNQVQQMVNQLVGGKKSNETIAKEVIQGKWGNGQDRINRLKNAGYDYNVIQKMVNQLL